MHIYPQVLPLNFVKEKQIPEKKKETMHVIGGECKSLSCFYSCNTKGGKG